LSNDTTALHTISSWEDAKGFAHSLGDGWIFRGVPDAEWSLRTSLERLAPSDPHALERQLLIEFQRKARGYLDANFVPSEDNVFRWWALMQHYNAPTRLLDWTHSFYIACFFAFEPQPDHDKPRALWAARISWLQTELAEQLVVARERQGKFAGLQDVEKKRALVHRRTMDAILTGQQGLVNRFFLDNPCLGVLPVEPWLYDARQAAQQSIFLCPADGTKSFTANIQACRDPQSGQGLLKVQLDYSIRRDALRDLQRMNVTASTLFPGLDGLGRSLQTRYV
jgi:hypothetical protein